MSGDGGNVLAVVNVCKTCGRLYINGIFTAALAGHANAHGILTVCAHCMRGISGGSVYTDKSGVRRVEGFVGHVMNLCNRGATMKAAYDREASQAGSATERREAECDGEASAERDDEQPPAGPKKDTALAAFELFCRDHPVLAKLIIVTYTQGLALLLAVVYSHHTDCRQSIKDSGAPHDLDSLTRNGLDRESLETAAAYLKRLPNDDLASIIADDDLLEAIGHAEAEIRGAARLILDEATVISSEHERGIESIAAEGMSIEGLQRYVDRHNRMVGLYEQLITAYMRRKAKEHDQSSGE